jgi:hypothetical protein
MSKNKLTENQKELLRKFVGYKCEQCNRKDFKLQCHRIRRGCDGGLYEMRNIKMLCSECHKKYHFKEFR